MHGARLDVCVLSNNPRPAQHEASAPIVQPMKRRMALGVTTRRIGTGRFEHVGKRKCGKTGFLGAIPT
jgi:hypothetical protein